ncbi:MAG: hypothetical protein JHC95_07390 [Solirubrobacteraceae bacterium]|nr:hypothetical protein [Solirubrobacteraceae bacterium]
MPTKTDPVAVDDHSASAQLAELRELSATDPAEARRHAWLLLLDLGERDDRQALHELWLAGDQPAEAPGRTVGVNLGRVHDTPRARMQNMMLRFDPWTGKTIGSTEGYNRLLARALPTVKLLSRRRAPWRDGDEIAAFPFDVEFTDGAIEPRRPVLAINYGAPRHGNPTRGAFPVGRIRDEVVELVDGVYVARVLFGGRGGLRHISAFGLLRDEPAR